MFWVNFYFSLFLKTFLLKPFLDKLLPRWVQVVSSSALLLVSWIFPTTLAISDIIGVKHKRSAHGHNLLVSCWTWLNDVQTLLVIWHVGLRCGSSAVIGFWNVAPQSPLSARTNATIFQHIWLFSNKSRGWMHLCMKYCRCEKTSQTASFYAQRKAALILNSSCLDLIYLFLKLGLWPSGFFFSLLKSGKRNNFFRFIKDAGMKNKYNKILCSFVLWQPD